MTISQWIHNVSRCIFKKTHYNTYSIHDIFYIEIRMELRNNNTYQVMARKWNFLYVLISIAYKTKTCFRRYNLHALWSLKTTYFTTLSSSLRYYPFPLIQWATCCCRQYERASHDWDTNNIEKNRVILYMRYI